MHKHIKCGWLFHLHASILQINRHTQHHISTKKKEWKEIDIKLNWFESIREEMKSVQNVYHFNRSNKPKMSNKLYVCVLNFRYSDFNWFKCLSTIAYTCTHTFTVDVSLELNSIWFCSWKKIFPVDWFLSRQMVSKIQPKIINTGREREKT